VVSVLDEDIPVVTLPQQAQELETELLEKLDRGETQSLAVAEVSDGTIVTDDGDAGRTTNDRDVNLTGSIGLLVRFVEEGRLPTRTADGYLKRWIDEAGFRSPARDLDVFLEP